MRLIIATTNPGKIREIRRALEGLPLKLDTLESWRAIQPPDETGATFAENARQKALYYAAVTRELVVAEDSGLEIDALAGAPGVQSARYGGVTSTYPEKFSRIYRELAQAGGAGRAGKASARFVCALALARGDQVIFESRGVVEGVIAPEPKGTHGFGYDPIFFYPPYGRTLGEVTDDEKLAVSHRGAAFRQLREFLLSTSHF